MGRLAHILQHWGADMLRRDLELPGDMVLHQLLEKRRFMVGQKIVKPDTAADEDLFDPRQLPQLSQELEIVTVIGLQIFAGGGEETLLVGAGAVGQLLLTGGLAEICRGAAEDVYKRQVRRWIKFISRSGIRSCCSCGAARGQSACC